MKRVVTLLAWLCLLTITSAAQGPLHQTLLGRSAGNTNSAVFVQGRHRYDPGSTAGFMSLAYTSNNTAGNLLIATASFNRTCTPYPACFVGAASDTRGNTWNMLPDLDYDSSADNVHIVFAYAMNCAAGANTVTLSNSGSGGDYGDGGINVYEFSGIFTAGALDGSSVQTKSGISPADGTPTSNPTSSSVTTSARTMIFVSYADEHVPQSGTYAATGTGFVLAQGDPDHTDAQSYRLGSNAGSYTPGITTPLSATGTWGMTVAAFKVQ